MGIPNKIDGAFQVAYTVPGPVYFGTKTAIEALTGIQSGAFAIGYTTTLADGQFGFFDGAAWHWDTGGGGGTPGGSDTEIQVNDSGAFAGYPTFRRQANGAIVIGDIDEDITIEPYSIGQGADGSSIAKFLESFGAGVASYIALLRARGTHDAPEAVQSGDVIGRISGGAYDGTGWSISQLEIRLVADGDWSAGDNPTRIEIYTTPDGSDTLTLAMTIQSDGNINITSGKEYRINGAQHTHDGWNVLFDTLTYATANTFTISGDWTSVFTRGVKIRLMQTSVKYFSVVKSVHSSGTTTVTVTGGSDYSLANAAITDPYYSNWENPTGFPATFSWTPTFGGFSADPTGTYIFRIMPQGIYVDVQQSVNGTSNATSFSISAPPGVTFAASARLGLIYAAIDNSLVVGTTPGYVQSNAGGTQYNVSKDFTSGINGWTASNGKRCRFTLVHPIA